MHGGGVQLGFREHAHLTPSYTCTFSKTIYCARCTHILNTSPCCTPQASVLHRFAPFPRDRRGLKVSRNISFKPSHSAASHLFPIIFAPEDVGAETLATSLDTWAYTARPWERPFEGVELRC